MDYRHINAEDYLPLKRAITRLYNESIAPQMRHASLDAALAYIMSIIANGAGIVVGNYIAIYGIGNIWYMSGAWVFEEMVIKVAGDYEPCSIDLVPLSLKSLASNIGARGVICGDAQRGIMDAVYLRAGAKPIGRQYLMEV
jgi:hypothetical protein